MASLRMHALLVAILIATAFHVNAQSEPVRVRWLGVGGFSIVGGNTTLLVDPYFSRYELSPLLIKKIPYCPDSVELRSWFPSASAPELAQAKHVLIAHSHFDHLGDAPWIAGFNRATIHGSVTTQLIAEAYAAAADRCNAPEMRYLETKVLDPLLELTPVGEFTVRAIKGCHGPILGIPFEGAYSATRLPPAAPFEADEFLLGGIRSYLVKHPATGVTLLITSSGCLDTSTSIEPEHADVVLAAAPVRSFRGYVRRIADLQPAFVVPHHYEDFFHRYCTERNVRFDHFVTLLGKQELTVHETNPFEQLCVSRAGGRAQLVVCPGPQSARDDFAQRAEKTC